MVVQKCWKEVESRRKEVDCQKCLLPTPFHFGECHHPLIAYVSLSHCESSCKLGGFLSILERQALFFLGVIVRVVSRETKFFMDRFNFWPMLNKCSRCSSWGQELKRMMNMIMMMTTSNGGMCKSLKRWAWQHAYSHRKRNSKLPTNDNYNNDKCSLYSESL